MRARTDCAGLVAQGSIRINRQPTGKPHAKLRVGDVLTIPVHGSVRVLRVASLAIRRGPAAQARLLYVDVSPDDNHAEDSRRQDSSPQDISPKDISPKDISDVSATSCIATDSSAYRAQ
jgi:ribosome-associated heat shock protein Hsp15